MCSCRDVCVYGGDVEVCVYVEVCLVRVCVGVCMCLCRGVCVGACVCLCRGVCKCICRVCVVGCVYVGVCVFM